MVEGPGCTLKGEKLGPRAKGQVVKGVLGNAVDRHTKKKKRKSVGEADSPAVPCAPSEISPYHVLLGHASTEVLTLGKELFMFFEGVSVCLRIHFLMAGGFRVNGQRLDTEGGGEAKTPSLVLRMNQDVITFNKCSAEMRPAEESRSRVMAFRHLDICSSHFHHGRAVQTLMAAEGTRIMCDLLLDQTLLPGVGNIIKNEALFDSGIKPDTKVSDLTEAQLSFLVKMTRDFTMIFYKCRKTGKPLQPYMKIYRKAKCAQCGAKATTTRMGVDGGRLTTYCPLCQGVGTAKSGKLPSKNSLLGWVTSGASPSPAAPDWACAACTFLNKASATSCSICLTPSPSGSGPSQPSPGMTQGSLETTQNSPEMTQGGITQGKPKEMTQGKPIGNIQNSSYNTGTAQNSMNSTGKVSRMPVRSSPRRVVTGASKRLSDGGEPGSKRLCVDPPLPSLEERAIDSWRGVTSPSTGVNPAVTGGTTQGKPQGMIPGKFVEMTQGKSAGMAQGRLGGTTLGNSVRLTQGSPGYIGQPLSNYNKTSVDIPKASPGIPANRATPNAGRPGFGIGPVPVGVGLRSKSTNSGNVPQASRGIGQPTGVAARTSQSSNRVSGSSGQASQPSGPPGGGGQNVVKQACPQHKVGCMIREVRKENQNKHRMFFCCPAKNCNFFMWADESFPHCEAHGKRCVLRTVLKDGPNNGRRFFACPQPKKKQCNTFHWADQYNAFTIR